VTVAVYYGVGFRAEPADRTGFAHLFEHLLFQGSENLPEGIFGLVSDFGGSIGGSTRFDFTSFYEVAPAHVLEVLLWAEADRMARPLFDADDLANERRVVANEVHGAVTNQPYGGWPWLDLPQAAFDKPANAHNFYGELSHIEAATIDDARAFHQAYYGPGNAVLVVAGDFRTDETRGWVRRHFEGIPARAAPPPADVTEAPRTQARLSVRRDPLAPRPAWTGGWRMPERGTPEWFAMGLIDQMLAQGPDGLLRRDLVGGGVASRLEAGVNVGLGNLYNYDGPMLWTVGLIHEPAVPPEAVTARVEAVIERLRTEPVGTDELARARTKVTAHLYGLVDTSNRFALVDLLAVHALFDDDPGRVGALEAGFAAVTPELIQATAATYLRPSNRTILLVEPGAAPEGRQ
jgi:predicted Zn-dependent peptidase